MTTLELPERKIYSVSELTKQIRDLLETEYPSVWVKGEVSNFHAAPSGHLYFTLKDESSQIRCVMFRLQSRFLKFKPEDGLQIVAWGRLSVYSPRGEYQLILDTMEPLGMGGLMLAFEQLKDNLTAEGLFDEDRRKPLPRFPNLVGLVTSPRGAAVRDMIRIIGRRSPGTNILVSPTKVQGDQAPEQIVAALERLCRAEGVEVTIIGRGGGSIEDLWAFNDERVVRAVAACPLPIVSAVGHETDFTLTDFAADVRASTPSAAAELVVPDRRDLQETVIQWTARMRAAMARSLDRANSNLSETLAGLLDPRRGIQDRRLRLDDLSMRLSNAMRQRLVTLREDARGTVARLRPEHLNRAVSQGYEQWESLFNRLAVSSRNGLKETRSTVESLVSRLDGLSPSEVLARGYSITFRSDTRAVIRDSTSVEIGEDLRVRFHRGELSCRVTDRRDEEQ